MTETERIINAVLAACSAIEERKEEADRLNVFPVPDGDTGTNMAATMASVCRAVEALGEEPEPAEIRKAISTGALMGARGNSGVITSQILRGLCEGTEKRDEIATIAIADALERGRDVAFQAVRKPVKGTILTVLEDCAKAARKYARSKTELDECLEGLIDEAWASVERTPEYLEVLAENGVVDSGAFGLAVMIEAFASSLLGKVPAASRTYSGRAVIEQIDDWEGSRYRYCNEFLVQSDELDPEAALAFLATMGDCELCVGNSPRFKVHVHSDHPDQVLAYFLARGQISEVFIHNMETQSHERVDKIASSSPRAPLAVVAVAAGPGIAEAFEGVGAHVISGGQGSNPSTADILGGIETANADAVIVLPNNKNVVMAAQQVAEAAEIPCKVVTTMSVPEGFAAMIAFDANGDLDEVADIMVDAVSEVKSGEVCRAARPSKTESGQVVNEGDVIGITHGKVLLVGNDLFEITMKLLRELGGYDADVITLIAASHLSELDLEEFAETVEEVFDVDVEMMYGGQELYDIIVGVE